MAVTTTPILSDSSDSLLRFALRLDGTLCAGVGLLTVLAAGVLPLTVAGNVLVLAVGMGCAWLQYLGVRRLA